MSRKGWGWALTEDSLAILDERAAQMKPTVAVECGSGLSTVVLRKHAQHVVSLEHLEEWWHKTAALTAGTQGSLVLAPMRSIDTPAGTLPFYDAALPDNIDLALIDGPPGSIGRAGALFALWPHLSPNAVVLLDDWSRPGEVDAVATWSKYLPIKATPLSSQLLEIRREGE